MRTAFAVLLTHLLLSFSTPISNAQASADAGHGFFLGMGIAESLEGRGGEPLTRAGRATFVEASMLVPGGSYFLWEVGAKCGVFDRRDSARGTQISRELSAFFGTRFELLGDPLWFGLMPILRANLLFMHIRDQNEARTIDDRVSVGARLGPGLEWELWHGTSVAILVEGQSSIAPLTASIGVTLAVAVQALP